MYCICQTVYCICQKWIIRNELQRFFICILNLLSSTFILQWTQHDFFVDSNFQKFLDKSFGVLNHNLRLQDQKSMKNKHFLWLFNFWYFRLSLFVEFAVKYLSNYPSFKDRPWLPKVDSENKYQLYHLDPPLLHILISPLGLQLVHLPHYTRNVYFC